jgi:uncharacterized protein YerC
MFAVLRYVVSMNRLEDKTRALIVKLLTEGSSLRSISRVTGTSINTVTKLQCELGEACTWYHDKYVRGLTCERVEMDEIWSFVGHKSREKADPTKVVLNPREGDIWTWKCLCAASKLIVGWHVGGRMSEDAMMFCHDLAPRFEVAPQISTDGLPSYQTAIASTFGSDVDYGRLVKIYKKGKDGRDYCVGAKKEAVFGSPDMEKIATSYVERSNLTLRMTNAHSKKIENHVLALGLHFFVYNFCRKHQTLGKQSPAQAAGITDHVWSISELLEMFDAYQGVHHPVQRPAHYKPRRSAPRAYTPTPKELIPLPWYLDPNGEMPEHLISK